MLNQNQNRFLERLKELGIIPDISAVNFKFEPSYDFIDVAWRSPKDELQNLIDINMNPREVAKIRIKDNH